LTSDVNVPYWIFSIGAGIGVLLIGIAIFVLCQALAGTLRRLDKTLDEVDRQIAALSAPVAETLGHVGGIADSADAVVARLAGVVALLETIAGAAGKTTSLAGEALRPVIVNVGATLTGVTAGLRRLVNGKRGDTNE